MPGVTAKDDQTVVFKLDPPGQLLRRHADPAGLLPGPKEYDAYLPGERRAGPAHRSPTAPTRSTPTRRRRTSRSVRNPAWDAATDPIRKAYVDKVVINETVSQDSIQQQLQTGTPSADMEFDAFPPPSQLPALIAKKDPNLNLGRAARRATRTSSSTRCRRTTTRRCRR